MHLRSAIGNRILREFVAQIVQCELQARRKSLRIGNRFGKIGKQLLHLRGRFQMALGIAREQASGGGESAVMANAGENVQHFPFVRQRVAHAIGRQQRQRQFARNFDGRLIARFFFAAKMPLQFDINIFAAKEFAKLPHAFQSPRNSCLLPAHAPSGPSSPPVRQIRPAAHLRRALPRSTWPSPFCARNFMRVIRRQRF